MITAIIGAFLTILAAVLPEILKVIDRKGRITNALANRSLDELDAGVDRLRQPPRSL